MIARIVEAMSKANVEVYARLGAWLPELVVSYDDVAELIMANLATGVPFSRRRIGLALPAGERGRKGDWTPGEHSRAV